MPLVTVLTYFSISTTARYFFYTTACYIYYIASYVDNNTSYNFDFSLDIAVTNLGKSSNSLN